MHAMGECQQDLEIVMDTPTDSQQATHQRLPQQKIAPQQVTPMAGNVTATRSELQYFNYHAAGS